MNPLVDINQTKPRFSTEQRRQLAKFLPELLDIESIISRGQDDIESDIAGVITVDDLRLPIYAITVGTADVKAPTVLFVGGIHGLERVGSHVVISFLQTLVERLLWDETLIKKLEKMRLVFIPVVNPGGMLQGKRSNPKGVDLMRNAPIEALDSPPFLIGGQRISNRIPWYRGEHDKMEEENIILLNYIKKNVFPSEFSLVLDCHSGFGFHDRIWFPYAYRKQPINTLKDIFSLKLLLDQTFPHHNYRFEPQSHHYLAHGDFWDYTYKLSKEGSSGKFLPLTLEMGSWRWVKKNPLQLFSMLGLFNPIIPHRLSRTKRKHMALFDFLTRAAYSYHNWLPEGEKEYAIAQAAISYWYNRQH